MARPKWEERHANHKESTVANRKIYFLIYQKNTVSKISTRENAQKLCWSTDVYGARVYKNYFFLFTVGQTQQKYEFL